MKYFKILIYPISLFYGFLMFLRNFFFDVGILRSKKTGISSIVVGNLKTGGTGKTPHVEFLIRKLKKQYKVAVLSRGYGRITSGFLIADNSSTSQMVGDEPLQIKNKFSDVVVAVCANRNDGIKNILKSYKDTNLVILDDAFQHRYLKPNLSILLTEYSDLYINDFILPTGNLREFKSGADRADIIIVTKTPEIFSPIDKRLLTQDLNIKPHQSVFFSYTSYGKIMSFNDNGTFENLSLESISENKFTILLVAGIANPSNLEYFLKNKAKEVNALVFPDHYQYKQQDIIRIKNIFDSIENPNKIILTTEKDTMRLAHENLADLVVNLPIFYIPIEIKIHNDCEEELLNKISTYVRTN
jgi:tetraacyldisaccharide 4'-kinase